MRVIAHKAARVGAVWGALYGAWQLSTDVITTHEATPDHASATANGKVIVELVGIVMAAAGLVMGACRPLYRPYM